MDGHTSSSSVSNQSLHGYGEVGVANEQIK